MFLKTRFRQQADTPEEMICWQVQNPHLLSIVERLCWHFVEAAVGQDENTGRRRALDALNYDWRRYGPHLKSFHNILVRFLISTHNLVAFEVCVVIQVIIMVKLFAIQWKEFCFKSEIFSLSNLSSSTGILRTKSLIVANPAPFVHSWICKHVHVFHYTGFSAPIGSLTKQWHDCTTALTYI